MINNERIGDDRIHCTLRTGGLRLAHAIADHFAAAEFHFLAIDGEVFFDLDEKLSISQAHLVANSGAIHLGISGAGNSNHGSPIYWGEHPHLYCVLI